MNYSQFRTGLTFADVRRELQAEQHAAALKGERMFVTRRTVLGRWHRHKQELWIYYQQQGGNGEH